MKSFDGWKKEEVVGGRNWKKEAGERIVNEIDRQTGIF